MIVTSLERSKLKLSVRWIAGTIAIAWPAAASWKKARTTMLAFNLIKIWQLVLRQDFPALACT